ncbi:Membrane-associated progesterone receptor component 1 [Hondaea fermentalgiana]|uniref:Membrane-associated progesterone receptor component 1 n=1 Tax=Hondaea fermentalgiana TaxID=2315210 RepID=A0A2R5GCH0_9STRA|nr:Membrane-associated progesterone receptor component 1 [Hondaea fermentalgiana]|eukprot:GBG25851.1 Membrane-associated progesterone receptor component 1 [Hondaea fermentalgiana]
MRARHARTLAVAVAVVAMAAARWTWTQGGLELALMRFFRDVSRAKSRARLQGRQGAIATLSALRDLVQDDEDPQRDYPVPERDDGLTMTAEELAQFDGSDPEAPLYLGIMGRIYDVTSGREYYGVGRSYHHFVGRDATRAFCTGCTAKYCLVSTLAGLDPLLKVEARRWLELYELHDEYTFIGTLVADPVEGALQRAQVEEQMLLHPNGQRMNVDDLYQSGVRAYKSGRIDDARIFWRGTLVSLGEAQETTTALSNREELRARTLEMLGATALKHKEVNDAIEHFEEAVDILRKVLTPTAFASSQLAGTILSDLGAAYFSATYFEKSAIRFKEALQCYEASKQDHDASHTLLLANTRFNLARALSKGGEQGAARSVLEELVTFLSDLLSADDKDNDKLRAVRKPLEAILSATQEGQKRLQ